MISEKERKRNKKFLGLTTLAVILFLIGRAVFNEEFKPNRDVGFIMPLSEDIIFISWDFRWGKNRTKNYIGVKDLKNGMLWKEEVQHFYSTGINDRLFSPTYALLDNKVLLEIPEEGISLRDLNSGEVLGKIEINRKDYQPYGNYKYRGQNDLFLVTGIDSTVAVESYSLDDLSINWKSDDIKIGYLHLGSMQESKQWLTCLNFKESKLITFRKSNGEKREYSLESPGFIDEDYYYYSVANNNSMDIKRIDLNTGEIRELFNCKPETKLPAYWSRSSFGHPSIYKYKNQILYFSEVKEIQTLFCYDINDGKELWNLKIPEGWHYIFDINEDLSLFTRAPQYSPLPNIKEEIIILPFTGSSMGDFASENISVKWITINIKEGTIVNEGKRVFWNSTIVNNILNTDQPFYLNGYYYLSLPVPGYSGSSGYAPALTRIKASTGELESSIHISRIDGIYESTNFILSRTYTPSYIEGDKFIFSNRGNIYGYNLITGKRLFGKRSYHTVKDIKSDIGEIYGF